MVSLSMPVTKWNYQITSAEEVADAMAKAFYFATTGRPGPVLIDITKDAQTGLTEFNYKRIKSVRSYTPKPELKTGGYQSSTRIDQPFIKTAGAGRSWDIACQCGKRTEGFY